MAKFDVDEALVRKLSELLDDTGLTEIEYRAGEQTIRVSRGAEGLTLAPASSAAPTIGAAKEDVPEDTGHHPGAITAPMVGVVFYKTGEYGQRRRDIALDRGDENLQSGSSAPKWPRLAHSRGG